MMYTYWYNLKILPSQTRKQTNTLSIIKPRSNIIRNLFDLELEDDNWDREKFSYYTILRKKIKSTLLQYNNMNIDVINIIVDYLYYNF